MRRFFLLILTLWKQQAKLYLSAAFIGALLGVFVIYPLYDFIYFHEHGVDESSASQYVLRKLKVSLRGDTPEKTLFLAEVGLVFGLMVAWVYGSMHRKLQQIEQLSDELGKDLQATINQGEGPMLEFKSSFRWDLEQSRINKALEVVVLKTLAGFLNTGFGGTLLVGVDDHGRIIGLNQDLQALKRKDCDGFEQAVMTTVAANLGADVCQHIQVLFHVIDEKQVCRLIVLPSPRPVFLKQNNDTKFFLRTGGGTRDLNIQEATEYISNRWKR